MSSSNRKSYQMDDLSISEFFKASTRFLSESISKESQFEKPYLEDDYRKMSYDFTMPDWPPYSDAPGEAVPGLSVCAITCYTPLDCDEPVWCHPSIWCGTDISCSTCSWIIEGATIGYTPHQMSKAWTWGIDIWLDPTLVNEGGNALVHVQMTDPCGNLCGKDLEITCKICPPEVAMTWDSSLSASTIGRSTSVAVYAKDGLGPYTWVVTGTGFSMLHNITSTVANSLVADATACGAATITVTDFCGDTATGYVRCTTGQWVEKSATCELVGAASYVSYWNFQYFFEYIIGNKKQREIIIYRAGGSIADPCGTGEACIAYSAYYCLSSPFIEGYSGNSRDITPNCQHYPDVGPDYYNCFESFEEKYFEWEC